MCVCVSVSVRVCACVCVCVNTEIELVYTLEMYVALWSKTWTEFLHDELLTIIQ